MKTTRLYSLRSVLAVLFFTASCQVQQDAPLTSTDDKSKNARLSADAGVLEVNYEVETTSRKQVLSYGTGKKSAALEAIYGAPTVSSSTVHLKILADGSAESEVLFNDPTTQNSVVKHKSLPDPSPRISRAVMKGGQLYLYNTQGKLTGTRPVPVENFKSLLNEMKAAKDKVKANNSLAAKATGQAGIDVDDVLEMAKARNGQVRDINANVKEVEMDIDQPARDSDGNIASSFHVKYKVDTKRNLMLGGEFSDRKTAKLLNKTVMLYKHRPETNDDVVSAVYSEDYREDAKTGRREKRATTCRYKSFELKNNIN